MRLRTLAVLVVATGLSAPGIPVSAPDPAYEVLVFTRTAGYRHESIPAGVRALRDLGAAHRFTVTATEDPGVFSTGLDRFAAVVFLNTSGDVLDPAGRAALEAYVRGGGGFVGVHAAADTEYGWPFYGELVGAWFARHPEIQRGTVRVENRAHASTAHLPRTWTRTDEWYDYRTSPRDRVRVLASLSESSYAGGGMGADHPITWCQAVGGGRSWYTGLGHTTESYAEPDFRAMLLGGIRYAAGRHRADCRPENGYTALVEGWEHTGPGGFTNRDGTLHTYGGMGLLWYADRRFTSFSLKLDWRAEAGDDNAGVFVGFDDPARAVTDGFEVQIEGAGTGAVYGVQPATLAGAMNPPGEWNTFELLVEGRRLRVYLNGRLVNDFTAGRELAGHVGIQNHGGADDVSFRHIRIREL